MNEIALHMESLCREAGTLQLKRFGDLHTVEYKGAINIVTEVDKACEALIVEGLSRHYPDFDILAEEGSDRLTGAPYRFIVDPLDGTVNYAHGFPFFAAVIALEKDGELTLGVTYDPVRDEMFTAIKGQGTTMNGRKVSTSKATTLLESLLATGFAYNVREEESLDNLDHFADFIKTAQAVRRPGSAAIDLAWVACGRIDGFWELFLKPWDMAAGVVQIREAGGLVTTFDKGPYDLYGTEILAAPTGIHGAMAEVLLKRIPMTGKGGR